MRISALTGMARILKQEGIRWVSTFPTCGINNALGQEGVPLLMMRDERYAVAVADATSRVTGGQHIGVCTVMGGLNAAGLQMAYGALAQAFEDATPLLCISDAVPAGDVGNTHFDIAAAFRPICKWIGQIEQPQRTPDYLRRAFTHLRNGRPGPVLLTVSRTLGEYEEDDNPYTPVPRWRWAPDPENVRTAVRAWLGARQPLLYVGAGVLYAGAEQELRQLAEMAHIPVLTTLKGKSAFPEDHPLALGVRGDLAVEWMKNCDVLLAVGTSLTRSGFRHTIPSAGNKTIIHCTVDTLDINKCYPTACALVGDARLTLQRLMDEYAAQGGDGKKNAGLVASIAAAKEQMLQKYRPAMASNDQPINPYRVFAELQRVLDPHNSFVTHDSGNTRDQLTTVYEVVEPHGFLGWGNVTTLGFGFAAALAAKLAYPERQCINVTGDAGVGYMLGNLEAGVRYHIGITTVHINNGGFGGYGPGFWGGGHDPYTHVVSDHAVADLSAAAQALGLYAEDVRAPEEIAPALRRALAENARGRPAYLEVLCSQYPVYGDFVTGR